jgi:hypothetical protein
MTLGDFRPRLTPAPPPKSLLLLETKNPAQITEQGQNLEVTIAQPQAADSLGLQVQVTTFDYEGRNSKIFTASVDGSCRVKTSVIPRMLIPAFLM